MKTKTKTLTPELLRWIHGYWRAVNYLSVWQIYRYKNPLLNKPLTLARINPRSFGHSGTTPRSNFIYVQLNRVIKKMTVIYLHYRPWKWRSRSAVRSLSLCRSNNEEANCFRPR